VITYYYASVSQNTDKTSFFSHVFIVIFINTTSVKG